MIVVVNLNLALEKELVIDNFNAGKEHRPKSVLTFAGGKGVNVCRVLKILQEKVLLFGLVGGMTGKIISFFLEKEAIPTQIVTSSVESRTILSIVDPLKKTTTEIYDLGERFRKADEKNILKNFSPLLSQADFLVIAGSLPQGISRDIYAKMVVMARKRAIPQMVDTSGEALKQTVLQNPAFLQCNRREIKSLINIEVNENNYSKIIEKMSRVTKGSFIITLSEQGSLCFHQGKVYRTTNNKGKGIYPVGSGNAFTAGFVKGMMRKWSFPKVLRFATATATAHAMEMGVGKVSKKNINEILPYIKVQSLSYESD